MPYIDVPRRKLLSPLVNDLIDYLRWNLLLLDQRTNVAAYIALRILEGVYANAKSYADYNEAIGAIDACRLEYKRRTIGLDMTEKTTNNLAVYPIVTSEIRDMVDGRVDSVVRLITLTPELVEKKCGVLNYTIFRLMLSLYPYDQMQCKEGCQCPHHDDDMAREALDVLKACKREYYRKHVVPYEDEKIIENGDVI